MCVNWRQHNKQTVDSTSDVNRPAEDFNSVHWRVFSNSLSVTDSTAERERWEAEVIRGSLGFALVKRKVSDALSHHRHKHKHTLSHTKGFGLRDGSAWEHHSWSSNQSVGSDRTLDKMLSISHRRAVSHWHTHINKHRHKHPRVCVCVKQYKREERWAEPGQYLSVCLPVRINSTLDVSFDWKQDSEEIDKGQCVMYLVNSDAVYGFPAVSFPINGRNKRSPWIPKQILWRVTKYKNLCRVELCMSCAHPHQKRERKKRQKTKRRVCRKVPESRRQQCQPSRSLFTSAGWGYAVANFTVP